MFSLKDLNYTVTRRFYKHFLNKSFCWVTYVEFRKSQQDEISPQAPNPHQFFHYLKNAVSSSNLQSAKQVKKIFFRCPLQASIPTRLDHMQLNTICAFYYYYNIPPPPFLKCYILTFFNFSTQVPNPIYIRVRLTDFLLVVPYLCYTYV